MKSSKRQSQISERRSQIPRLYRAIYDKAVTGKSRKAAMHSFCLECCGYQITEVYACTDLGCSLYPYRPRSRVVPVTSEDVREPSESPNDRGRDNDVR